jgi:hypothetical protein
VLGNQPQQRYLPVRGPQWPVVLRHAGGDKYFFFCWHGFRQIQGMLTLAAAAAADDEYFFVHLLFSFSTIVNA